jgi:cytochrome c
MKPGVLSILAGAMSAALVSAAAPAGAEDRQTRRENRALIKPCKACHDFRREKRKFGPHLVGVIGRPIASAPGYKYSGALTALGSEWTKERLAAFLNDPQAFATGTNMKFPGFKDEAKAERAAAYITQLTTRK